MAIFTRPRQAALHPQSAVERARSSLSNAPGLPFTFGLIPSSVHGVADYVLGAGAIVAPWLFRFANKRAARFALQGQGLSVLAYSLFTDYELGAVRVIPFRTHLLLDILGGSFLLAAPRLLGFRRGAAVCTMLGLVEFTLTMLTRRQVGR